MTLRDNQNELYVLAARDFGPALARLARAYEADADLQRDLLQDIHFSLWRSFATFDAECSLRTWIYRIAHNTGASHLLRRQRLGLARMTSIDELEDLRDPADPAETVEDGDVLARLTKLVQRLKPADKQIILLYLEGLTADAIGEICGLSAGAVATKIHRLKATLAKRFHIGGAK